VRRICCVLLVVPAVLAATVAPAGASRRYEPPVPGLIIDHFRPPVTAYGPGNRGIDYGTTPGEVVRAAADGIVVFAGRVGLGQHVVVLHPDGLRTSYSFLAGIDVRRGDHVGVGDVVGHAGEELHFGARTPDDHYLDPEVLLATGPTVHLVPAHAARPGSEAEERQSLLRSLAGFAGGGAHAAAAGVAWARDAGYGAATAGLDALQTLLVETLVDTYGLPVVTAIEMARGVQLFREGQRGCTSAGAAPRRPTGGRHLLVLVAGLGSASGNGAVLDVDTARLGYAAGDVAQFSYRGGQAPGSRTIDGIEQRTYTTADSETDIGAAGARLHALLVELGQRYPGVPVDVIAHSQGGLVTRVALAVPEGLPRVDHVITLATPHGGADLADLNRAVGDAPGGPLVQLGVREVSGGGVDPFSTAVGQLRTDSRFHDDLEHSPLPDGVQVTSIAASGDYVVPAPRAALDGATNVVVPVSGLHPHDALPGSDAAAREMALALAGQRPTCVSIRGALLGAVVGMAEHQVAATAELASGWKAGVARP
jgi:hypothetical protein